MDEFDKTLLSAVDEILQYSFGDFSAQIILKYLEKRGCSKSEIPSRLDAFSEELRRLLGPGKGQILGSAPVLEEAIAERLCFKLGVKPPGRLPVAFPIFVQKLKEDYCSQRAKTAAENVEPSHFVISVVEPVPQEATKIQ